MSGVFDSVRGAFAFKKVAWIVYVIQLLLVIPVGLQLYQVMEASFGSSLSASELMDGFNYRIIQDFLNVHGASLSPLIGYARWLVLVYLMVSAFVGGGIWHCLHTKQSNWKVFWKGCAQYFRRFLIIGLIFLILFVVWSLIIWGYYLGSFFNMMETWLSDSKIIHLGIGLLIIWMMGLTFLFVWSSIAKIIILKKDDTSIMKAFRKASILAFRKYLALLPALLFYAILIFGLYALGLVLERRVGITSVGLIVTFLLIQQLIVWLKIVLRIGVYRFLLDRF